MRENYNSMYWIKKRIEHEELATALREADRRRKAAERRRAKRAAERLVSRTEGESE
jgi:hypothetical protein